MKYHILSHGLVELCVRMFRRQNVNSVGVFIARQIWMLAISATGLCAWDSAAQEPITGNLSIHDPSTMIKHGNRYYSREVRTHDPSAIIKCKDEYWVFCTGPGVPSYHSKDLKKWERSPSVFTNAPGWIAQAVPANRWIHYWAPDVIHLGDRYLLYYSVSSFGKNRSAIGLATNPTLDPADPKFQWIDQGIVVQSTNTDNFNTIDPAVSQDANGNLWLAFGSFWGGIKIIQLDPNTGKPMATNSPLYSLAFNDAIEASYIHRHDGYYYLFVNWGRCCLGTNSTYEVRVGRSKKIIGPYLDKDGTDLMTGGGSPFLKTDGSFIGPGQVGIISEGGTNWLSCHFYDGTRSGMPTLAILPLRWDAHGWPEVDLPR
jgi:arabinan endo-1,5-alpha-L-arabinosidase